MPIWNIEEKGKENRTRDPRKMVDHIILGRESVQDYFLVALVVPVTKCSSTHVKEDEQILDRDGFSETFVI